MGKILLFYKYVDIEYPKQILKWQKKLCEDLGLRGRILIAHEGINGTVGGDQENVIRYKSIMQKHPLFKDVDFKESDGSADYFPKMYIAVKDEVVRLGIPSDKVTVKDTGVHLDPKEVHKLLEEKPADLIILDARNTYESKIGHFKDAVLPDINHFREFPEYIDKHAEQFKDKKVLMYCTGGIRCERASAYLKQKGIAQEVFQINGGIHRYIEQYPNGFFRGKNYVFDGRIAVKANDDVLGECELCKQPCDDYTNCYNAECNKHFICCADCEKHYYNTCSTECMQLINKEKTKKRPEPLYKHLHDRKA